MMQKLQETVQYLKGRCQEFPKIAIVLGSGLSGLLDEMKVEVEMPYHEIPHLKMTTVEGHRGRLVIGELDGTRVVCMQGRLHFFEGHTMQEVVFPVRALALAGAEVFLLTNSTGGLHSDMKPLDLLLVKDHINLMGTNPLLGPNDDTLGPRFPDMTYIYDEKLRRHFSEAASRLQIPLREGVYLAMHGPSYETPAEIRMLRGFGADVVGMSTVPEAIALNHMKKRVVSVSCISNPAAGVVDAPLNHEEVLENARKAYGRFSALIREALRGVGAEL